MNGQIAGTRVFLPMAAVVLMLGNSKVHGDDKELAAQFYPQELAEFAATHPSLNETKETALLRVDLDGTGASRLPGRRLLEWV